MPEDIRQSGSKLPFISAKYFLFGAFIGLGVLAGIIIHLPDGQLHIYFCDVGQGDANYIRTPSNMDMLIDGGPDNQVLSCLGKFMPFYDRTIDVVVVTHPQKDHLHGVVEILKRYKVKEFITVPVSHTILEYAELKNILQEKAIPIHYLTRGDEFHLGEVKVSSLWPEKNWLIQTLGPQLDLRIFSEANTANLTGVQTSIDLNTFSLYLLLQYGHMDILFTGDGDQSVQKEMERLGYQFPANLEVLKVPHHGSKTGMLPDFIQKTRPQISIIEVGKNSYGHPSASAVNSLKQYGRIFRTDQSGSIELITNGKIITLRQDKKSN